MTRLLSEFLDDEPVRPSRRGEGGPPAQRGGLRPVTGLAQRLAVHVQAEKVKGR